MYNVHVHVNHLNKKRSVNSHMIFELLYINKDYDILVFSGGYGNRSAMIGCLVVSSVVKSLLVAEASDPQFNS